MGTPDVLVVGGPSDGRTFPNVGPVVYQSYMTQPGSLLVYELHETTVGLRYVLREDRGANRAMQ